MAGRRTLEKSIKEKSSMERRTSSNTKRTNPINRESSRLLTIRINKNRRGEKSWNHQGISNTIQSRSWCSFKVTNNFDEG